MEKTFSVNEARAALPYLRRLLTTLREQREALATLNPAVSRARKRADQNGGTPYGELFLKHAFTFAETLEQIESTGVIVKDFSVGLIDFPHEHDGRIVYLCWKLGEDDLAWWHEVDDGYAGRRRIEESFEKSH